MNNSAGDSIRKKTAPVTDVRSGARGLAVDTLLDISKSGAYASIALDKRLNASKLRNDDKRLATELVYGVIENILALDYIINSFLFDDCDAAAREILRVGAYQILYLTKIPSHSAVDESVKLTRAFNLDSLSGMVNAVLRNIIRADGIKWPDKKNEYVKYLSVYHSYPEWLVLRLIEAYGEKTAEDIISYKSVKRSTPLRSLRTPKMLRDYLDSLDVKWTSGYIDDITYAPSGNWARDKEFNRLFTIQGESSILAARALGVKYGDRILSACAAPGGKAAYLAQALQGTGRVLSWDIHQHRVEMIKKMAQRLKLDNIRAAQRDATILREELVQTLDAVLVDAPCSGLGVVHEKPDILLRRTQEDIAQMVSTQRALLNTCSQYVKPGGVLVYSTCSILPEENIQVVEEFLSENKDFTPSGLTEHMPEQLARHCGSVGIQLLHHRDGIDGFFISRMVRK